MVWAVKAYDRYSKGKQTLGEVGAEYGRCGKTMRKYFDGIYPVTGEVFVPEHPVAVVFDATFFSRHDGVLVSRAEKRNLLWGEVGGEKAEYYGKMADNLAYAGISFSAFVIDGRRGVRQKLAEKYPDVPIQLCQFHQVAIVKRYLTSRPKLEAGKELRRIALTLKKTCRTEFTKTLSAWHIKWEDFLNEKTLDTVTWKWHYVHRRLRSAYRSISLNLPWLFTYLDHPEFNIPNTTNTCDGSFAHWKNKLKLHRGLNRERRRKMMNYFLENS